jgi:hypothetical protein
MRATGDHRVVHEHKGQKVFSRGVGCGGDRGADSSDPDQPSVQGSAYSELAADRRKAVPVVPGDELVGLPKVK